MKTSLKNRKNKFILGSFISLILSVSMQAQDKTSNVEDTLTLDKVISLVIQNNPIIKQAGEVINYAELGVKLAKSGYMPILDANGTFSRMAPIPSFDIPNMGHIQMYPDNSIGLNVELYQNIYDFGKTSKNVLLQESYKELSRLSEAQIKQSFALSAGNIYYNLYYLQTDWEITNEHLNTLKKHLEIIKNKQRTGSATQYEILSIQVNVSSIETELNEIQSNYGIQLTRLNTLMGTDFKQPVFSADTSLVQGLTLQDSSYAYATFHRNDLLILGKQQDMANINYKRIQSEYLPTIGLFGSGGWNNGYMPEIEQLQANYVVGLSFKMPIFDGNRKNIKLKMAKSDLSQNEYEIENTTRVAMNEISESYSQLQLSTTKIYQSKVQVQQAQEAYNHAEINFKEGAITNLDLIYAEDMLSNSKLQLLKNEIDYQKFLLIFKAALGETIY